MKTKTEIISNGSKWAGEAPDSIEKLLEVLKDNTIEERFFHQFIANPHSSKPKIKSNLCPISHNQDKYFFEGATLFFGSFEERSHVFRIATNDPEIIEKLSEAIKNNKGWKKYYEKHLVKEVVS